MALTSNMSAKIGWAERVPHKDTSVRCSHRTVSSCSPSTIVGPDFAATHSKRRLQGQLGKVEIEDQVRGVEFLKTLPFVDSSAHRHHGLELWRLHGS